MDAFTCLNRLAELQLEGAVPDPAVPPDRTGQAGRHLRYPDPHVHHSPVLLHPVLRGPGRGDLEDR